MGPSRADSSAAPVAPVAPDDAYRLPRTVEPHTYRLVLEPDLDRATFEGTADIEVTVHEATDTIVCNAAELEFSEVRLRPDAGGELIPRYELDPENERVQFHFGDPVPAGPATLHCTFSGILNDRLHGFYRSTFTDQAGETQTIATTQMESTDARRAFPCWDEPDRKAVFDVTLVVDERLAAFANSAVASEEVVDGRRRLHFAPTMKMSTYLVAFVVGPLEATAPQDVDGVPVRIVHVPGKAHLTAFAHEIAAHSLRFFTDYFGIPYPADKLDLVAIPDFAFGAMENLGCVTFRETALLVDPATAARVELERVADVVAHEIAHMWFGDLVTMRWWEGIWLNEAFATFMEVLCVDAFRPAWHRWLSFGVEREMALGVDGLHSTRPIEYPVGSPAEADGMFDLLTYQKGGSVLRMLEQYLGADTFRDGIRIYLQRHAYANTVTGDLWQALEDASGEPVRALMDSWILQGGHPLVSITQATLAQRPFAYSASPAGADTSAIGDRWHVPVRVRSLGEGGGAEPQRVLLTEPSATIELPPGPAVINAGGWGVYRSAYPAADLLALGARLGELDPLERALLFADSWALAVSEGSDPERLAAFFSLAASLGSETEPTTWSVVAGGLGLCHRVGTDDDRAAVARACQTLLGPRLKELTWHPVAGEDERTPSLRATLLRSLGVVGHDEAIRTEAARLFDRSRGATGEPVDPDIEGAVLDVVADQCRDGDYEAILEQYRNPATPQQEQRYLFALASFPDPVLAERTFDLALSEVRTQNAPYLVGRLLAERVGGPSTWQRLKDHWDEALDKFPVNSHSRMLEGVTGLCADGALADDVTRFLTEHPLAVGPRHVTQILERLAINRAFAERHRGTLAGVVAPPAEG